MKKISIVMLAVFILSFCASALATEPESLQPANPIEPKYVALVSASAGLELSGNSAICQGKAKPKYSNYSVDGSLELQVKNGSSWDEVAEWTGTGGGSGISITGSESGLASGSYRAKLIAKVYDANDALVETVTVYSSAQTC